MKKIHFTLLSFAAFILVSCSDNGLSAEEIIQKSIIAHGSILAENAQLEFNFRGIDYSVNRFSGEFEYQRRFTKNGQPLVDRLNNDGFSRRINDSIVVLPDSLSSRYSASLNSVIYFAQLPYGLDGDAVILENLGMDTINEENYHQIKVTFKENGGGEDHEDVFLYWIDAQDYMVDFLAYSYCEDDCGFRFRESRNRRNLKGIIVQDYKNYRSTKQDVILENLDDTFEAGELILMSEIKTEFPEVTLGENP